MKKLFKKKEKPIEERSIIELLDTIPHVSAMNKSTIIEQVEKGEERIWLNPNNQTCFNFGWFNREAFVNWAMGTGPIVKGKTQAEKDKFIQYARAYDELNWQLFCYEEYLDLLDQHVLIIPPKQGSFGPVTKPEHILDTNQNSEKIISTIWSNRIKDLKKEIRNAIESAKWEEQFYGTEEYRFNHDKTIQEVYSKENKRSFDVAYTMALLGHGYFDACNTPCIIENLSWSRDLPFAVAYYEYLKDEEYDLPDFKFVRENRYK